MITLEPYDTLQLSPLFNGIEIEEIEAMIPCLGVSKLNFSSGDYIIEKGTTLSDIGFLTKGKATIIAPKLLDTFPKSNPILPGDSFGDIFIFAGIPKSPISVMALENSEVYFFNFNRLISSCSNACTFHSKVFSNLIKLISRTSLLKSEKISCLTKRTTRSKISSYLILQKYKTHNNKFKIPLNRNQLAEYLSVDRSAMSRELGKMRREGIINFSKNMFEILDEEQLTN